MATIVAFIGGRPEQLKTGNILPSIQNSQKLTIDCQNKLLSSLRQDEEPFNQKLPIKTDSMKKESMVSSCISGTDVNLQSLSIVSGSLDLASPYQSHYINDKKSCTSKTDQKTPVQNGSGQKLESIIGRLSSDKGATANDKDDDTMICRADASTQTFPDFIKVIIYICTSTIFFVIIL